MIKKKPVVVLFVAFLLTGLSAYVFLSASGSKESSESLAGDVGLLWPEVAQAAIGSVERGLLASSCEQEKARPIASMAKLITALAVMEKQSFKPGQEGQIYTITRKDLAALEDCISEGGSVLPLLLGMKLTQCEAMQRMLIASDNNTADLLVKRIFGSMQDYVLYATKMLRRMGLDKTIVADASGINPATVSTPSDLISIGIAALQDRVIARIVAQQQARLPVAGLVTNTNQLLGNYGVIGVKTGTTSKAGSCLLFAARYRDRAGQKGTLVGVIMGDKNHPDLYRHAQELLASAKQRFGREVAGETGTLSLPALKEKLRNQRR